MSDSLIYPKEPFIGVDCGGQPNAPPMIAVATRYTRRNKEDKWISRLSVEEINKHKAKRDWQEKVYASIVFKSIDRVLQPKYEIHLDEDYQNLKQRKKVLRYIKYLIGVFHAGDPAKENPTIYIKTKRNSKYVKDAHEKHCLARRGKIAIDEKTGIDHLMKILEDA